MVQLDPATLERLRRSVPLRMSAMGHLTIGGEPVTHPRIDAALREGLDLSDTGEPTVRIGPHWIYLTVDDCPLRATAVLDEGGAPTLRLDDGRTLPLATATLRTDAIGLRCEVPARRSGRPLAVRLTNAALMDLEPWLEIDDDGHAVIVVGAARTAVPGSGE